MEFNRNVTNNGVAPPIIPPKYQFNLTISANSLTNFNVGASYTKEQIETLAFTWETPKSWENIIPCMIRGLQRDWISLRHSVCNHTSYILTEIKEAYNQNKRGFTLSFVASSMVITGSGWVAINHSGDYPKEIKGGGIIQLAGNGIRPGYTYHSTDKEEISILPSEKLKEVKKYREQKKIAKKEIKKFAEVKKLHKELKAELKKVSLLNEVKQLSNERKAEILLNHFEGFFNIIYWDFRQYSVGYGTYISYEDCKKLWNRMGLSENEGKKIAWEIHDLQKQRGKYGKVLEILAKYKNHKGSFTKQEANEARDRAWNKFNKLVEENYTYLPDLQKRILTNLVYNCGWVGFFGGKVDYIDKKGINRIKVYPRSELATLLQTHEWSDKAVYEAFLKHKIVAGGKVNKGLINRRLMEANAFHSTVDTICYNEFLKTLLNSKLE